MAVNQVPIFVKNGSIGRARVAVANTATDGSGTIGTLFTFGADGSRVDRITYTNGQATAAASSAMVVKLFISDNGGANWRIYREIALATATRSTTVIGAAGQLNLVGGIVLPTGYLLGVAQSVYAGVQDQMDYIAEAGDY